MVKKLKSKKEVLYACNCKSQETTMDRSLEDKPRKVTEGKDCKCRIVSQEGKEPTQFGKKQFAQSAIIRTEEPTGGFVQ